MKLLTRRSPPTSSTVIAFWIRVLALGTIGGLAGSRLAQLSDATWWQVTPRALLVLLWAGLWKHRERFQQRWSTR